MRVAGTNLRTLNCRDSGLLEQWREPERRIRRNLESTRNVAVWLCMALGGI